ncbi:hypothetical protein Tco_0199669 [Tanacetum coccineum]
MMEGIKRCGELLLILIGRISDLKQGVDVVELRIVETDKSADEMIRRTVSFDVDATKEGTELRYALIEPSFACSFLYVPSEHGSVINFKAVQKEREKLHAKITLQVTNAIANIIPSQIKFEKPAPSTTPYKTTTVRTRDHEDHHDDDAHPKGESRAKRHKMSKHGIYSVGESLSKQAMDQEPNMLGSGTQEQLDEFDDWMDDFVINDDEVPTEEVSPKLIEEISGEVNEAQLQKAVNDMPRQRSNSGKEHRYHVDQMQNYLKSDIVWESRKERLSLPTLEKSTPLYHSFQRDPKAPPMTLLNQDLFYLKYGKSGPKKYTLSLHKYPAVLFPEDDIEERISRWQKDKPEEVYSESKIVELIRTSYELGHEHKVITEIVVRRANGKINPITESYYKHLNKNNIEDLYLLRVNGKVKDNRVNSYQQKVNLTAPTITFSGIERKKLFITTSKLVIGMIYENNKKEKRVMILMDNFKFCYATLKRVLEMFKKYNKDVKYGHADPSPSDADAQYLQFYKEDIENQLKHRDQMRRWEIYVNGRPLCDNP